MFFYPTKTSNSSPTSSDLKLGCSLIEKEITAKTVFTDRAVNNLTRMHAVFDNRTCTRCTGYYLKKFKLFGLSLFVPKKLLVFRKIFQQKLLWLNYLNELIF
jgi:hypothetical protein